MYVIAVKIVFLYSKCIKIIFFIIFKNLFLILLHQNDLKLHKKLI